VQRGSTRKREVGPQGLLAVRPHDDELIPLQEAAHILGMHRTTLHVYIRRGDLATFRRIGDRRTYVRLSKVETLRLARLNSSSGRALPSWFSQGSRTGR